jgi:predicted Zn-dependent protease
VSVAERRRPHLHRHRDPSDAPRSEWQPQPTLLFPDAVPWADQALEVAADVMRAGGAADAEISVSTEVGESALTRFAGSAIHQNVHEDLLAVRLTVSLGGRTASVHGSGNDPALFRRLATAALEAARVQPLDPDWPGLAPPAAAEPMEHVDQATATASPAARAELVRAFLDAAGGLDCAGYCATRGTTTAYVNSAGQRLADSVSFAALDGVARSPLLPGSPAPGSSSIGAGLADGSGRAAAIALADINPTAVGRHAARTARAAAEGPVDVDAGAWPVVLRPSAVADVLAFLAVYGLNSRAVAEGRSFARLGGQQLDPGITLVCDPLDPRVPALPFDDEGTPRRTFELVREGVPAELAADRRDAHRDGTASNGCATGWSGGGIAPAVGLHPGSVADDELLGGLGRALLVHDFWYTRVLDPRPLTVTGLTRNGLFLIEDGVIRRAGRNVRFTQSYADALAPGNVLGVGGSPELIGDVGQSFLAPSLALRSWNVTGNAQG